MSLLLELPDLELMPRRLKAIQNRYLISMFTLTPSCFKYIHCIGNKTDLRSKDLYKLLDEGPGVARGHFF